MTDFARSLAALYPSASGGSGQTLSPLSAPAPTAPPASAASPAPTPTTARAPAASARAAAAPPAPEVDGSDDADEGTAAAAARAVEAVADAETADAAYLTIDERADWFKDARLDEIPAAGVTDYASVTAVPKDLEVVDPRDRAAAMTAAVKMGIGITQMQAFHAASIEAARNPITTTPAAAEAALRADFGDKYEAKMAAASAYIAEVQKHWPNVKVWLNRTGLGNDPQFIRRVITQAERRSK